ncbi:MAG: hypothetical protein IJZ73_02765 [Clostridia bacterium]|nr:hypothetical protein [Clostridia bacterium]
MDKFGILRLLTSFFDFYQKNRDSAPKGMPFDLLNSLPFGKGNDIKGAGNNANNTSNNMNNAEKNLNLNLDKNFNPVNSQHNLNSPLSAFEKPYDRARERDIAKGNSAKYHSHLPLQAGMLATLKTHDNFVKRVKEKHGV